MLDMVGGPSALVGLLTLTLLEIVLGIDNIVFISILVGRLPVHQQPAVRRIGLLLALVMRIALLLAITWVMRLTTPLFSMLEHNFSGRDLILLAGGLFLLYKASQEIFELLEIKPAEHGRAPGRVSAGWVIAQIVLFDLIFSLDSVITAVGLTQQLPVMILAIVMAIAVMLAYAGAIGEFVDRHPSMKMLALSFLILIGVLLVAEGMGQHLNRGYVYFAMAFSVGVELLNMRRRAAQEPVTLHRRLPGGTDQGSPG